MNVTEAFVAAVSCHQAGRLAEAAALYRSILAQAPDHVSALNNLGLLLPREQAIPLFGRAVALNPDYTDAHRNLGNAFKALGALDGAIDSYRQVARLEPDSAEAHFTLAHALLESGAAGEAEQAFRRVLTAQPMTHYLSSLAILEPLLKNQGREAEAVALYEQAIRLSPGNAFPATRRAALLVRRHWGAPPEPVARQPGPYVTMATLGQNGRFGNQILQYGFLRVYAHLYGLGWEVPDWIGRDVFGLDDPMISGTLPVVREDDADLAGALRQAIPEIFVNCDFWGYFVGDTSVYAPHRDFYRSVFGWSAAARRAVEPAVAVLRQRGRTLVALHLRRGDFGYGRFWIAPESWYVAWLTEIWSGLTDPVLFIATDDPGVCTAFSAFSPLTGADLPAPPAGVEFLVDFGVLVNADLLAISNSTFSFAASLLNTGAVATVRPCQQRQGLVAYDPWAALPLL